MSGVRTGVSTRIQAEEKRALNTTCLAHSLNLAVQDATNSNSLIGDVLMAVQELNTLVRSSAKRLAIFEKIQHDISPAAPSLKPLCPTRWTVRYSALLAVQANFESIMSALEQISDEGTSADSTAKSRGLLRNVSRFEFLLGLKVAICLFGSTDELSRTLQNHALDVGSAVAAASVVQAHLRRMTEPEYFEPMWKECLDISEKYEFAAPQLPRYRRAPRRIDDGQPPHLFPDVKSHFRQKFVDVVDSVMGQMERRFDQPALRVYHAMEKVLFNSFEGISCEDGAVEQICSHFGDDIDQFALPASLRVCKMLGSHRRFRQWLRQLVSCLHL